MEEYRLITSKKELCTKTERTPLMPLTTHDNRTDKNFQVKHVYDRSYSQGKKTMIQSVYLVKLLSFLPIFSTALEAVI